jgi:anti-sigma-K factor RskA
MTHDDLRELTGAYALGALSDGDRRAFEAHLASCAECAREVRELGYVASGLAVAVAQVNPPAALRQRVLDAALHAAPPAPRVGPTTVGRLERATPPRASALPSWLAAAAAIAAVAVGLYAMTLRERIGRLEEQLREANARAEGVQHELQIAQSGGSSARQIATVLDAPDVRAIDLLGQKGAPTATGRCYYSPTRGMVFTASNLPAPTVGRQYQLWVIPKGSSTPVSAGMLNLEGGGLTMALVDSATARDVGTVAVTMEPAGGVPQPTSEPVLVATW